MAYTLVGLPQLPAIDMSTPRSGSSKGMDWGHIQTLIGTCVPWSLESYDIPAICSEFPVVGPHESPFIENPTWRSRVVTTSAEP